MAVTVTAVIKAKNEAGNIVGAVRSALLVADRVLVVDDSSTDGTAELARGAGAEVLEAASSAGRIDELDRLAFSHCTSDWILRMDADERMTPTLAQALRHSMSDPGINGVQYARKNMMFGGWARYGGWFSSTHLGFFRLSAYDPAWSAGIHSQVPVEGRIRRLPLDINLSTVHYDYSTVEEFAGRTLTRYAKVEACERFAKGDRFSELRLIGKPVRRFLGRYLVRKGYRDGRRGLVLAILLALYDICIELNLWDLGQEGVGSSVELAIVDPDGRLRSPEC